MKLDAVGEFGLIDLIQQPVYQPEQLILGIGDDCAVLPFDEDQYQLVSCDLLTEDIHFIRHKISAYQLGYKAVAVNLSDVAAMGGRPIHILLSVALPPDYTVEEWQEFYRGVADICGRYRVNLIGGDTTSSREKLTINVTVLGLVKKTQLHLRRHAKPGDVVFVTGPLGGSRAGLELLLKENSIQENFIQENSIRETLVMEEAARQHLLQCHCQPEPCCQEIETLNRIAEQALHGLNDISDGLLSECGELAAASEVALVLEPERIPVDWACSQLAEQLNQDGLQWAMTGGEDYQLVGTLDGEQAEQIAQAYEKAMGKPLIVIGYVEQGRGVFLETAGKRQSVHQKGYDHFGKADGSSTVDDRAHLEDDQQDDQEDDQQENPSDLSAACQRWLESQLRDLQQQEEAQRVYRHDLQNHLACLSGLLEWGKPEEARAYLKQMMEALPQKMSQSYSERIILNLLFQQAERKAEALHLDYQIGCVDGLLDFISDYDLCTLLGNLLNNGLEHSDGGDDRYLYLDILRQDDGAVVIQMENSCSQMPVEENGLPSSRKTEKTLHGKGLKQIQSVTNRYQGQFFWSYDSSSCRFLSKCVFYPSR